MIKWKQWILWERNGHRECVGKSLFALLFFFEQCFSNGGPWLGRRSCVGHQFPLKTCRPHLFIPRIQCIHHASHRNMMFGVRILLCLHKWILLRRHLYKFLHKQCRWVRSYHTNKRNNQKSAYRMHLELQFIRVYSMGFIITNGKDGSQKPFGRQFKRNAAMASTTLLSSQNIDWQMHVIGIVLYGT